MIESVNSKTPSIKAWCFLLYLISLLTPVALLTTTTLLTTISLLTTTGPLTADAGFDEASK